LLYFTTDDIAKKCARANLMMIFMCWTHR